MNVTAFKEAQEAYARGDYERALAGFGVCARELDELAPADLSKFYHLIGNCYIKTGKPVQAAEYYQKALDTSPRNRKPSLLVNLGTAQLGARHYEDALISFTSALDYRDYATPYRAHSGIGAAQLKLGNTAQAGAAYRAAALDQANPMPAKALVNLGVCFMELGRPADAIVSYETALEFELDPIAQAKALSNLGQAYMAEGRAQKAIEAFEEALESGVYELTPMAKHDYAIARKLRDRLDSKVPGILNTGFIPPMPFAQIDEDREPERDPFAPRDLGDEAPYEEPEPQPRQQVPVIGKAARKKQGAAAAGVGAVAAAGAGAAAAQAAQAAEAEAARKAAKEAARKAAEEKAAEEAARKAEEEAARNAAEEEAARRAAEQAAAEETARRVAEEEAARKAAEEAAEAERRAAEEAARKEAEEAARLAAEEAAAEAARVAEEQAASERAAAEQAAAAEAERLAAEEEERRAGEDARLAEQEAARSAAEEAAARDANAGASQAGAGPDADGQSASDEAGVAPAAESDDDELAEEAAGKQGPQKAQLQESGRAALVPPVGAATPVVAARASDELPPTQEFRPVAAGTKDGDESEAEQAEAEQVEGDAVADGAALETPESERAADGVAGDAAAAAETAASEYPADAAGVSAEGTESEPVEIPESRPDGVPVTTNPEQLDAQELSEAPTVAFTAVEGAGEALPINTGEVPKEDVATEASAATDATSSSDIADADITSAFDHLDKEAEALPSPEETEFFEADEKAIDEAAKDEIREERKRRGAGLKVAIVLVVLCILVAGAGAVAYFLGYGYPTQEAVASEFFTAATQGGDTGPYWGSNVEDSAKTSELTVLKGVESFEVDAVERSSAQTSVYMKAQLVEGGTAWYKVAMARSGIGWNVQYVELFFPSAH